MPVSIRDHLRHALITEVAPAFQLETPLAQQRQTLEQMGLAGHIPEGVAIVRGDLAGMNAEWLTGPGCSSEHTLLHLHGGGYVMGSCGSHRSLTSQTAVACGIEAVLPEYRLAPEHPSPAALEDAVAAYRALLALGREAHTIVLLGDSAGGGLALATLVALRDAGVPLPAATVLLSPWTDLTFSGESVTTRAAVDPWISPPLLAPFSRHYIGDLDPADPRVSPLFADLRGLPPMLIQVGDQEVLLSDSTRLADRARAAGVDVTLEVGPELWHVYQLYAPVLPDAVEALARIGAFVRGELGLDPARQ